ncbi:flagellar biosynthetic protein FliR [Pikeienuella piscinae]|uniref:Flagellar biosynthetic protein FliR n=2 Tax=Pikeienuella piscinae TaxID=2748098 RepID=A0A7M3T7G5_9RHOB|nr:flagellar biosynthetic protein FliR [Pikeienuella piscinae]
MRLFAALGRLLSFSEAELYALVAVFVRVGAVAVLLPGFGEQMVPMRVRLVAALAFTAIVWPAVAPGLALPFQPLGAAMAPPLAYGRLLLAEAACGLVLGLALRFLVFALQLTGSMAAQATSVAQIFGGGATPDPMPAIGNLLVLAGIALALASGLHVKAALAMIGSYEVLPFGVFPVAGDLAEWGVARAAQVFDVAFMLASPFIVAALVYNVALGAINRAMPQLMVAFVGAPAITAGALLFLLLAAPVGLAHWSGLLDVVLAAPFATPR